MAVSPFWRVVARHLHSFSVRIKYLTSDNLLFDCSSLQTIRSFRYLPLQELFVAFASLQAAVNMMCCKCNGFGVNR